MIHAVGVYYHNTAAIILDPEMNALFTFTRFAQVMENTPSQRLGSTAGILFFRKKKTRHEIGIYRPPPAQAQAHPAQAQAHAQPLENPPPLLPLPRKVLEVVTGTGLVLAVTAPVNEDMFPTAPVENAVTVLTTDAAASEPGRLGRVMVWDFPPEGILGMDPLPTLPAIVPRTDGSARYHQPGMKTGPLPKVRRVRWS